MSFRFDCPFCNQHLDCDDELDGQVVKCPYCNQEIAPAKEDSPEDSVEYNAEKSSDDNADSAKQGELVIRDNNPEPKKEPPLCFAQYVEELTDELQGSKEKSSQTGEDNSVSSIDSVLNCTARDGSFRKTILCCLFYYVGWFEVIVAVIVAFGRMMMDANRESAKPIVYIIAAVMFICGVLNIGIAQIIYCISRTCWNTERIAEILKKKTDGK